MIESHMLLIDDFVFEKLFAFQSDICFWLSKRSDSWRYSYWIGWFC